MAKLDSEFKSRHNKREKSEISNTKIAAIMAFAGMFLATVISTEKTKNFKAICGEIADGNFDSKALQQNYKNTFSFRELTPEDIVRQCREKTAIEVSLGNAQFVMNKNPQQK